MALLRYLQPFDGLPDPKSPLLQTTVSAHQYSIPFMIVQWQSLKQSSVCTTAVLLQLLPPICPGKHMLSMHAQLFLVLCATMSPILWCELFIVSNFCGIQIFVGSLTHKN